MNITKWYNLEIDNNYYNHHVVNRLFNELLNFLAANKLKLKEDNNLKIDFCEFLFNNSK